MTGREIDDRVDDIERALKEADGDIRAVYVEVEKDDQGSMDRSDGPAGESQTGGDA
jgi:divalent metal cation (Fe/Co/Zn/Cd) transporter